MNVSLWCTDAEVKQRQDEYQRDFGAGRVAEKPVGSRYGFFSNEHAWARPMDQKTYAVWHHVRQGCSMLHYDLIGEFDQEIAEQTTGERAEDTDTGWDRRLGE